MQAVIWLEDYLQKWKKTLVVVSHARDFLDAVATDIVHVKDKKLIRYKVRRRKNKQITPKTKQKTTNKSNNLGLCRETTLLSRKRGKSLFGIRKERLRIKTSRKRTCSSLLTK